MGVACGDSLSVRAAMMRESLRKSQSITDDVLSILRSLTTGYSRAGIYCHCQEEQMHRSIEQIHHCKRDLSSNLFGQH